MATSPHILMVVTSNAALADTGRPTGLWVEELAAPYRVFQNAGFGIDIASPLGGRPPFDPISLGEDYVTPTVSAFLADPAAQARLGTVERLADVADRPYDGVFIVGGFGVMWDLVGDPDLKAIVARVAEAELPVAAVCHAPAVLADVVLSDGTSLIAGRAVTGFSDGEEEAVGLGVVYARTVEGALRTGGGKYESSDQIFGPYVTRDGRLHTGQNPASSEGLARQFAEDVSSS